MPDETEEKKKKKKYCVKCKTAFDPDKVSDPFHCPRCDHQISLREDFNYQFFGEMGAHTGCGCWVVIIAIIVIIIIASMVK